MATLSAPSTPSLGGGLIDPSKQAEYPIFLGDKLARKETAQNDQLINITYNYKSKTASSLQRAMITSNNSSSNVFKLVLQGKAPNAERTNLEYTYRGSVDPGSLVSESETSNLVLVFDSKRKAFILEPVSTKLNFNLRSAPGKTEKQILEQYPQLNVLPEDDHNSVEDRLPSGASEEDVGAPDEANPYDFRHFLPKAKGEEDKGDDLSGDISTTSTPDPHHVVTKPANTSLDSPASGATKSKSKAPPKPKPKPKANNPLRQQKRPTKASEKAATSNARPTETTEQIEPSGSPTPENGVSAPKTTNEEQKSNESPSANIIVDGDLIIDMGSPPSRPAIKIDPQHLASNNSSADEADYDSDDEEDIEELRLPSPAGQADQALQESSTVHSTNSTKEDKEIEGQGGEQMEEDIVDDDDLAAEMEAAFEESAREEERARNQLLQQQQQHAESDESEVSEEE